MVAAYAQKRKTWPDGEEVLLPGLVVLWDIVEEEVSRPAIRPDVFMCYFIGRVDKCC